MRYFGALKAIGVTNYRLVLMILLPAVIAFLIGHSVGNRWTALFFEMTKENLDLRGFRLMPEIMMITGGLVFSAVIAATALNVRRVVVVDPAVVFRG